MVRPERHIDLATRIARQTNVRRGKVSAIAFSQSGEILAFAHNRRVSGSPGRWTEHAEEVLLQKLRNLRAFQRYGRIRILVIRVNNKGVAMAKPCARCQVALAKYSVNVFYSDEHGEIKEL